MDLLRSRAGARRPPRWWDRGLYFCGVVVAALLLSLGLSAVSATAFGTLASARVESCHTETHPGGRSATYGWMNVDGVSDEELVDVIDPLPPGTSVTVNVLHGSVSLPRLDRQPRWYSIGGGPSSSRRGGWAGPRASATAVGQAKSQALADVPRSSKRQVLRSRVAAVMPHSCVLESYRTVASRRLVLAD
jgi:hypothetical protein